MRRYPPVLVTTGLRDTRVEWWGPVKFAWRLRAHQEGDAPIHLLWGVDGHAVDDPNQVAVEKTFLLQALGAVDEVGSAGGDSTRRAARPRAQPGHERRAMAAAGGVAQP